MQHLYARTLRRAAEVLGGVDQLAAYLDVEPRFLAVWMQGTKVLPPTEIFLRAVDLLTPQEAKPSDKTEAA